MSSNNGPITSHNIDGFDDTDGDFLRQGRFEIIMKVSDFFFRQKKVQEQNW